MDCNGSRPVPGARATTSPDILTWSSEAVASGLAFPFVRASDFLIYKKAFPR
jgi:hypothetical protein